MHHFLRENASDGRCAQHLLIAGRFLIDRDMMKKDLREAAGLSTNVIAKLGRNEYVSTEALAKICKTLYCEMNDILDLVDDEDEIDKNK